MYNPIFSISESDDFYDMFENYYAETLFSDDLESCISSNKPKKKFKPLTKKKKIPKEDLEQTIINLKDGSTYFLPSKYESDQLLKKTICKHSDYILESALGLESERPGSLLFEPEIPKLDFFDNIQITQEAFDKAVHLSRRLEDIYHGPPELYMHLLHDVDAPDNLITDVMVAHKQKVNFINCWLEEGSLEESFDWMEQNNKEYAGWSHSHSKMGVFHSTTDNNNLKSILFESPLVKEFQAGLLTAKVSYVPSVVVNVRGDHYSKFGFKYYSFTNNKLNFYDKEVDLVFNERVYDIDYEIEDSFFIDNVKVA